MKIDISAMGYHGDNELNMRYSGDTLLDMTRLLQNGEFCWIYGD